MRMYDIITKKKTGGALSESEICYFVQNYTAGLIPDYQASALLMAIAIKGMNSEETACFTMAVADSGEKANLDRIEGVKADKHSTGGVGDKTTLIAVPIAAACGVKIPKMSGRGLGHTGGTVDKLEAIPGYRVALPADEFAAIVNRVGCGIIGQTGNLAPADKKLYALRDVTATVDSLPLIVASIMGKKLAVGADSIVLDVKTGSGAFCKTRSETQALAELMVETGRRAGKNITALITDMDRPLGNAIGNSLEVIEAIHTLNNKGPEDLTHVSVAIATEIIYLSRNLSYEQCKEQALEALCSGAGFRKFFEMVEAFGGDTEVLSDPSKFRAALFRKEVKAPQNGYITSMNTERLGVASLLLGAGRLKKDDPIDYSAGIELIKKTGDAVMKDEALAILYTGDQKLFCAAEEEFAGALAFGTKAPRAGAKILGRISTKL